MKKFAMICVVIALSGCGNADYERIKKQAYEAELNKCINTDPNPFLVQMRTQFDVSPSARYVVTEACKEMVKNLNQ